MKAKEAIEIRRQSMVHAYECTGGSEDDIAALVFVDVHQAYYAGQVMAYRNALADITNEEANVPQSGD